MSTEKARRNQKETKEFTLKATSLLVAAFHPWNWRNPV
jgi:hypothetical protein